MPQSRRGRQERGAGDGTGGHGLENAAGRQRPVPGGRAALRGGRWSPKLTPVAVPGQAAEVAPRRALTRGPGGHPWAGRAEAAAEESSARRMRLSDLAEGFTKCLPISKLNYVFSVLFVLKYFSDMELHTHM